MKRLTLIIAASIAISAQARDNFFLNIGGVALGLGDGWFNFSLAGVPAMSYPAPVIAPEMVYYPVPVAYYPPPYYYAPYPVYAPIWYGGWYGHGGHGGHYRNNYRPTRVYENHSPGPVVVRPTLVYKPATPRPMVSPRSTVFNAPKAPVPVVQRVVRPTRVAPVAQGTQVPQVRTPRPPTVTVRPIPSSFQPQRNIPISVRPPQSVFTPNIRTTPSATWAPYRQLPVITTQPPIRRK